MKRLIIKVICLLSVLAVFCSACSKSVDYAKLDDLGGVYLSDMSQIDFSVELSSIHLIDSDYTAAMLSHDLFSVASNNSKYGSKVYSWGIKRMTDNKIPQADPGAPELLKKYNGLYLGDTSKKVIYLTFDEGYENGYTPKILDTLRNNNVKAAFFITGPYLKEHQDLVRRMVEEGHTVGNHTIHHPSLPTLEDSKIEEEVLGLERAFKEKFNTGMKFIRPPKGEYSERSLAITNKLGYRNVFWSFAYDDWYRDKIRGADYAYNIVMKNLHNGGIILLHAVSKDNAEALDKIIKGVHERGYSIGDINDIS